MLYMARWIVPSYYAFIFCEGLEEPLIVKVREFLEAVVYLHDHRDVKMGNILINSKVAMKLAEIAIFLRACLVLGTGNTRELFLMELLVGVTLKIKKIIVHGISIFCSKKAASPPCNGSEVEVKMEKASNEEIGGTSPLPPPPPVIPPNLKIERVDPPKRSMISRPGVGSSGHRVSLEANHFKVAINSPDETFYQYSVSISYEDKKAIDNKGIGRKIIHKLYQTYSSELTGKRFAYDGEKSLYTVGPLPQNKMEFALVLEESLAKHGSLSPAMATPVNLLNDQDDLYSQNHL